MPNTPTVLAVSGVADQAGYAAGANECDIIAMTCISAGPAAVILTGNVTPDKATFHVYTDGIISGGSSVPLYFQGSTPDDAMVPNANPLSYMKVEVPGGDYSEAETVKITVSSSRNPETKVVAYKQTLPPARAESGGDFTYQIGTVLRAEGQEDQDTVIVITPDLGVPNAGASEVTLTTTGSSDLNNISPKGEVDMVRAVFMDEVNTTFTGYTYGTGDPGDVTISNTEVVINLRDGHTVGGGPKITVSKEDSSASGTITTCEYSDANDVNVATCVLLADSYDPPASAFVNDDRVSIEFTYSRALEGDVTLTVGGGADVMLKSGFTKAKSFTVPAKTARTTDSLMIVGLPKSGNTRVEVTAEFAGENGGTLKATEYVIRSNNTTESLTAMTYQCTATGADNPGAPMVDGKFTIQVGELCNVEKDTKVSDLDEATTFAPDNQFLIIAKVMDSAGNPLKNKSVSARQTSPTSTPAVILGNGMSDAKGVARLVATIKDKDNAALGSYTITVDQGAKSIPIDIAITGPAKNLDFVADAQTDPIPANTGVGTYTVKATDENGNLPTNVGDSGDDFEALVSVRPTTSTVLGTDEGKITFDAKTGEATFYVQVSDDAEPGDSLTISVTAIGDSSIAPVTMTVIYGEAQPEMMAPGMPMNVMAEATSDTMITVSWESPADDGGSDITGYMVQSAYMMSDGMMSDWMDVDPAHMGMDMMYMDMGLMAETTYYYRVAAMNSSGMGDYSDMAMAMTMMAPMMDELGTPTGVVFGFNEGGALQVSWTKAANAAGYIIIAVNTNDVNNDVVVAITNDGDDETQNISGLTRGATYQVYVASTGSGVDEAGNAKFELSAPAEVMIK